MATVLFRGRPRRSSRRPTTREAPSRPRRPEKRWRTTTLSRLGSLPPSSEGSKPGSGRSPRWWFAVGAAGDALDGQGMMWASSFPENRRAAWNRPVEENECPGPGVAGTDRNRTRHWGRGEERRTRPRAHPAYSAGGMPVTGRDNSPRPPRSRDPRRAVSAKAWPIRARVSARWTIRPSSSGNPRCSSTG